MFVVNRKKSLFCGIALSLCPILAESEVATNNLSTMPPSKVAPSSDQSLRLPSLAIRVLALEFFFGRGKVTFRDMAIYCNRVEDARRLLKALGSGSKDEVMGVVMTLQGCGRCGPVQVSLSSSSEASQFLILRHMQQQAIVPVLLKSEGTVVHVITK